MRKVIDWNEYFIRLAKTVSLRSKDPKTTVGSVIVDQNNKVLSVGYNGFKPGTLETPELWKKPIKYQHVQHSEANAINFLTSSAHNGKIYTTMYSCASCAQLIANAGIKEVYYLDPKYKNSESEEIFKCHNIQVQQLILRPLWIGTLKSKTKLLYLTLMAFVKQKVMSIIGKKN